MDTRPKSSSRTAVRHKRRMGTASSSCSKSFARYCVALLGSLTAVSLASPIPAPSAPSVASSSSSLLKGGFEYGRKISRSMQSSVNNLSSLEVPHLDLHQLYIRANKSPASINKAATIVGVCGGIAFLFAIIGGVLFWRARRQRHIQGKCGCGEKGVACKYRPVRALSDDEEGEEQSGPRDRGISPPGSPRQTLLSPPPQKPSSDRIRWSVSGPRDSGQFSDVEGFEYPPNYKPPPSSFRTHSPSTSAEFLVPAGVASLISPISPLLSHRGVPNTDDVTITPPRTPSPARFAKRSQSPVPHLRGRSLSAVDLLSRSDAALQEDLDAIVRELQRRPRAGSIDSRLAPSRSNSPPPPNASQDFIMELEASPGMWNEDMLRNRGVVHEAVSQEFAVELDSRPLTLGVKRTRRLAARFQ